MNFKFIIGIICLSSYLSTSTVDLDYDFCNVNESKAAYILTKEILEYFNIKKVENNQKCLILNDNLRNYYERFQYIETENKNSYSILKCSECNKRFKNKNFLNLHFKLFHLSLIDNYKTKYHCPADYCRFLNCDRYKYYFSVPFADNSKDTMTYNRPVKEKYQECNKELVPFYRKSCMKLIEGCFDVEEDETNLEKYFEYYTNFCMKIDCSREPFRYNYSQDLQKEGSVWDAFRVITLYMVSIVVFIFVLVIWISKYS